MRLAAADASAVLSVEDTGIGIPPDELPQLFRRFHRARNAAAIPGSGLGLAYVKAVAERHGGRVVAENTGRDARFTVALPRATGQSVIERGWNSQLATKTLQELQSVGSPLFRKSLADRRPKDHPAPYYISHDSAMDIHDMLTRPVTVVTATSSRRLAGRTTLGIPYRFIYAPPTGVWGHTPVWVTPYEQVVVSDLERTLLDGLTRPDLCAGISQVVTALWMRQADLDWDKLGTYAEKLGGQAAAQRLGYLLELFALGAPALLARLQALTATGYVRLDPLLPDEGPYLARWRLRINIEPASLKAVIGT